MKRYLVLILSVIAAFAAAISLTACGKVDFTVKFSVDGETYASVSTGGSEVIKMPADPQKDGYTFDGWFWDDGVWARPFTANSLLNEPLKSDMTVYAKFSVNHSHNFNKQVATEPYLKSVATCTAKAVYYFSCECGEKGEQTFEYGDKLPHTFCNQITEEKYLKSTATCTAKAVYYYSCECGAASETETFEYGELKDHTFNGTHTCAVCGYYDDTLIKTEILSKNLSVCGNEIKGKVANAQATFSFINDIEVADGATYTVCTDLACTNPVLSKTINLSVGDNVCYILVTNGNDINLYTVTVRRRPVYTVAFNSNGGTEIKSQQVEEDSLAAKPADPEKQYYIFTDFEFDFSEPIVNDITINTLWEPVKFNIYYNLNGGKNNTDNPTTYTIEDKIELKPAVSNKLGYSFASWDNGGKIEKGSTGDKTFTANYTTDVKLSSDGTTVTGLNNAVSDLVILSEYDGVKVTSIGSGAFSECSKLTSITIPDGVTSIGEKAFYYCTSLTSITIPDSVTSIGGYALYDCSSLTSVNIPDGVTSIGKSVFSYCTSLTSVTIPNSVTSIGESAFEACRMLTSAVIGDGVTSIVGYAFRGCTSLTNITIPDSVTSIGSGVFEGCASLENIIIPDSVTSIGEWAFQSCSMLTSVTIGDSVTSIGDYAFENCTSLTSVLWNAKNCTKAGSEWSGVEPIFGYCPNLKSITIGDNVKIIPQYAFYGCTSLEFNEYNNGLYLGNSNNPYMVLVEAKSKDITSYEINGKCKIIYPSVFAGASKLKRITIPDSVTSVGSDAFLNCTSLASITIPDSVTSIGKSVFAYCKSLKTINYKGGKEQWDAISKGSSWNYNTGSYTINYNYVEN